MIRLSILGLDNLTNGHVWDQLVLPDGVDRQDVIDTILTECAELGLVYTEPSLVARLIGLWSRRNLENWKRIHQALTEAYNPIHNFDRYETWTDDSEGSTKTSVAGFNLQSGMADRDAAASTGKGSHEGHLYGNIGVTTSAQMIEGEMDVRQRYNVMEAIVNSFKDALCIQIY